jgi:hypothetical protein
MNSAESVPSKLHSRLRGSHRLLRRKKRANRVSLSA